MGKRLSVRRASLLPGRQRGVALLVLLTVIALGASWLLVRAFTSASSNLSASNRAYNARVLAEAKAALVGYVATRALDASNADPGRLPCPQYWGDIGGDNEGRGGAKCTYIDVSNPANNQPAVGWLPWRQIGIAKPLDASGEQLWYVVSPGWALTTNDVSPAINSNSLGQLIVDGQGNTTIALIIAPGAPLRLTPTAGQTTAGCATRVQSRAVATPVDPRNPLDFLECENASTTDLKFATSVTDNASNPVFNDQVLRITVADLVPALEAAIAKRIERDIVPALQGVYPAPSWGVASDRIYPYAAPFADPGTSNYQGALATYWGLMPVNQLFGCSSADPRCTTDFVQWSWAVSPPLYKSGGTGSISGTTCTSEGPTSPSLQYDAYTCLTTYTGAPQVTMALQFTNVAMGLRRLDSSKVQSDVDLGTGFAPLTPTVTALMTTTSGVVSLEALQTLPDVSTGSATFRMRIERAVIGDHSLLDPNNTSTGWFVRNEWFRVVYYATSQESTVEKNSDPKCGKKCLKLTAWPSTTQDNNVRALLILAGRSLTNTARPNGVLTDFTEFENSSPVDRTFEQRGPIRTVVNPAVPAAFNDRVIVVDHN